MRHLDFRIFHRVVSLEHIHELLVLDVHRSVLRDDDDIVHRVGEHHVARAAAAQDALRIREHGPHAHRAGHLVDDPAHGLNLTAFAVQGTVGQLQLHCRQLLQLLLQRAARLGHGQQLLFGHGEINKHLADLRHSGQGLCHRRTYQGTDTVGERADDTVRRTGHRAEAQVLPGGRESSLGLCQCGLGRQRVVDGRLVLEVTDDFLLVQHLLVGLGLAHRLQAGLCRLHAGRRLVERGLVLGGVNLEQRLSLADRRSLVHTQLHDETRHLRTDLNVLRTLDGGRILLRLLARRHRHRLHSVLVIT